MAEVLTVEFRGVDNFSKVAKGVSGGFGKMGGVIKAGAIAGVAGLTVIAGAAGLAGGKLLSLGSDAEETASLIKTSLGGATQSFNADLRELATETNRSFFEMQAGTSILVAMTKSMGATNSEAADLGLSFAGISADLGSFFNVADADVLLDLRSALGGSNETLQKYGVILTETSLKQMAMNQGFIEAKTDALDPLIRTQLIQQAIMEQASDAMGDAARTSESWSNSLKGLKAQIKDAATEAGQKLIPVMQPLLTLIGDLGAKAIPILADAFEKLLPHITNAVKFIQGIVGALQDGVSPLDLIADIIGEMWPKIRIKLIIFRTSFRNWFESIDWAARGRAIVTKIVQAVSKLWNIMKPKLTEWRDRFRDWFNAIDWRALGTSLIEKITRGVSKLWAIISPVLIEWRGNVVEWFEGVDWKELGTTTITGIVDGISQLWEMVEPTLSEWWDRLVDWYETTDWQQLGFRIMDGFMDWASNVDWKDVVTKLVKSFAIGLVGVQWVIINALKDIVMGAWAAVIGSIIESGGGSAGSFNIPGFARGGFTGNGGRNQIAGAVHAGEFVLNRDATRRIGVPSLNSMNNGGGNTSSRSQVINQNTIIYTSSVDTAGESRAAQRFATGGI